MKTGIHPTYYADATIACACGKTYTIGSTVKELHVEICANCHPFYTGKDKLVDTAGRVDRFKRIVEGKTTAAGTRVGRKVKRARGVARKKAAASKTEKPGKQ